MDGELFNMSHLYIPKLAFVSSINFNTTSDQLITVNSSKYIVRRIIVTNASASLTTAVGGIYNDTGKPAGGIIVAASQVFTALTANNKYIDLTLATLPLGTIQTSNLYLSLTISQGTAATADIYVFADILS